MDTKLAQLKTQIALGYLENKLITLNFIKAFRWASGWRTPIYTDNREALSFPKIRAIVIAAFLETIKKQGFEWDALWATVTAGIPWAAILAYELDKDLFIYHNKKLYKFSNLKETFQLFSEEQLGKFDAIISNTPLGIVYGAIAAHVSNKPFLYLREQKKEHGKENWIEGRFEDGIKAGYLHVATSITELPKYEEGITRLKEETLQIIDALFKTLSLEVVPDELKGKRIGIIEDLISTGGSSIGKEAENCRAMGGIVTDMIAVFHYKMQQAELAAQKAGINVHYLLDFPTLLSSAYAGEKISTDEKELLDAWYADPEGWSKTYLETHTEEVTTK